MDTEKLDVQFIDEILKEGIKNVFYAQRLIADNRYQQGDRQKSGKPIQGRSGQLRRSLVSPDYLISRDGNGVRAKLNYPIQIRFVDMKRLGNWKIYNRQLWGILYKETFVKMRYAFYGWLYEFTKRVVAQSYEPINTSTK